MSSSPCSVVSPPAVAKSSPLRRWGARAVLLLASVASVASSQTGPSPLVATSSVQSLTLSEAWPEARRVFPVEVAAPRRPDEDVTLEVGATLQVRWVPADDDPRRPSVRARMSLGELLGRWETTAALAPHASAPVELEVRTGDDCNLMDDCLWEAVLDVEVQGEHGPGVVEVEWISTGSIFFADGLNTPPEVTLTLGLP